MRLTWYSERFSQKIMIKGHQLKVLPSMVFLLTMADCKMTGHVPLVSPRFWHFDSGDWRCLYFLPSSVISCSRISKWMAVSSSNFTFDSLGGSFCIVKRGKEPESADLPHDHHRGGGHGRLVWVCCVYWRVLMYYTDNWNAENFNFTPFSPFLTEN